MATSHSRFSADLLKINPSTTVEAIKAAIREIVLVRLRKKGVVLGLSGGIDSSVTAALCARALGVKRVLGVFMPERDSDGDSLRLGKLVASSLGIDTVLEDITPVLAAARCYVRRDDAIRQVIPVYQSGWKSKIVIANLLDGGTYPIYSVVAQSPANEEIKVRLTAESYLGIVAATNFKQRMRKMVEYYHADRMQYAVAGTANRLEYDQGFFVKNGDGTADLKPIAHLYKTQVYKLAEHLEIPEEVRYRPPTTDTYSMPQSEEEFYFPLPLEKMDLCLYGKNDGVPPADVAAVIGLTPDQVSRVYHLIEERRKATRHLHYNPFMVEPVNEVPI